MCGGAVIAEQRFDRIGPFVYERHAAVPQASGQRHGVAIVGGGPVGLALALGLAKQGIASVVIEADDTVCMGSRAACVSRRSLEIVDRLGALPAFLAKGLPWTGGRSYYKQTEVFRFAMPHDPLQKLPPMINLQQYYIEDALLAAADASLTDIRWASRVTALDGHTLTVENEHGAYALDADWIVACDGGQSFVRKTLGLELEGTAYSGRYVIIDIHLPSTHPTERRAWFDPPWNRGSTVLMHRQPDDLWRIDYQLRHGESTEEALQPANVHAFVQRHLDAIGEGHLPWQPVWTSVYRAGAMTLASYRHGHVLFAGNAAHALPIFGVRGLNSGLDDADNLAWKLAFVVRGISDPALLDSYADERIAAYRINAENAMRSTEFMSPPSRGFDLLREAALSLSERHAGIAQLINPRQTEAVRYADSPLSSPVHGDAGAGPGPGDVLPQPRLLGGSLGDWIGPGLVLLALRPDGGVVDPELAEAVAALVARGVPLALRTLVLQGAGKGTGDGEADAATFAALGATAGAWLLLRPDGHVAARWHQPPAPAALRAAVARVCAAKALA